MRRLAVLSLIVVLLAGHPIPTKASALLYPDLRTLPARDLRFDTETIDGSVHIVLRFSNTVGNFGQGPLELIAGANVSDTQKVVIQRIYDDAGGYIDEPAGHLVWHAEHGHWHLENFARYELWTSLNGVPQAPTDKKGQKASFCVIDTTRLKNVAGGPKQPVYTTCGWVRPQGLSVGWGDTYPYYLYEQWIDLGTTPLADGEYAIRSIADPGNRLNEGGTISGVDRENNNEAWTFFRVQNGRIRLLRD